MKLTPKQKAVSEIFDHNAFVVSIPGSGKTGTSVQLAQNILTNPIKSTLLVVTFTRSGAGEIKDRLRKTLSEESLSRLRVATLDSCIVNMAKAIFAERKQRFDLVLGAQYMFTIQRIMNELGIDNHNEVTEVLDYYIGTLPTPPYETSLHKSIIELYLNILEKRQRPSFDLKLLCKLAISELQNGNARPFPFSHILVDEWQDTSALQYEWLKHQTNLAGSKIIAVGDDSQSIYAFNGAKGYDNFLSLQRDFNAKPYTLDLCFRCAPNILKFAESVIKHNKKAVKKEFGSPDGLKDGTIEIHRHERLVEDVLPYVKANYKDTAILTRNNRLLSLIEVALADEKIPYQRISGKNNLFSNHYIVAFIRILAFLHGVRGLKDLSDVLGSLGEAESNLYNLNSYLRNNPKCTRFADINWHQLDFNSWGGFTRTLVSKHQEWGQPTTGREIFQRLKEVAKSVASQINNKLGEKQIFEVVDIIYRKFKSPTLKERIETIIKIIESVEDNEVELDRERLTLSTCHSSKGLEWQTVWLVGADNGEVPAKMKESTVNALNDAAAHIEEERRLAYVAITRAERHLKITYKVELSPFFDVANLDLVKFIEPEEVLQD